MKEQVFLPTKSPPIAQRKKEPEPTIWWVRKCAESVLFNWQKVQSTNYKLKEDVESDSSSSDEDENSIQGEKKSYIENFSWDLTATLVNIEPDPSAKAKFILPCEYTKKQDLYLVYKDWLKDNSDKGLLAAGNKYFFKI